MESAVMSVDVSLRSEKRISVYCSQSYGIVWGSWSCREKIKYPTFEGIFKHERA